MSVASIPEDVRAQIAARTRGLNVQLAEHIYAYLSKHNPDSVRGVMYEMLSGPLLDIEYEGNNDDQIGTKRYGRIQRLLLSLRRKDIIPWEWIRDGVRSSKRPPAWRDLSSFLGVVRKSYRRDHWAAQSVLPHIVVEKDSAAGRAEPVSDKYGVWLHSLRGESSDTYCLDIANCIRKTGKPAAIVFAGDWDPCGENIERVAREKIEDFLGEPIYSWERVGLTEEQVNDPEMDITTIKTKKGRDIDKKTGKPKNSPERQWRAIHGDRCAEVEAIPIKKLRQLLCDAIEVHIDADQWAESVSAGENDQERLTEIMDEIEGDN